MRMPPPPHPPEMKPSSYSLLKFVFLAAYRSVTSFLRGAPPFKENPGSSPGKGISQGKKRTLAIMEESAELRTGHYIFHVIARSSLQICLTTRLPKKRLVKDLVRKYCIFMDDLFDKGHAQNAPQERRKGSLARYLPHHLLIHPP